MGSDRVEELESKKTPSPGLVPMNRDSTTLSLGGERGQNATHVSDRMFLPERILTVRWG